MIRNLVAVAVWTAVCLGVWLLTLSSVDSEELVIGSICALLSGMAAVAVKRVLGVTWSLGAVPFGRLSKLPVSIVADTAQILLRPFRPNPKPARLRSLDVPTGDDAASITYRVTAILALSGTPGSMAIDFAPGEGLLLHSLQTAGPRLEDDLSEGQ
jgi:multisubunit Na+/H+ antiporter MnhE subunit